MPALTASTARLPQTYVPPGTSTISQSGNLPGSVWRRNAAGNLSGASRGRSYGIGPRNSSFTPPPSTGTYRAAPAPPPATYTRGGIAPGVYNRPQPFTQMPQYGGKYDPVSFPRTQPYGTPTRPQLPRAAIQPRPANVPRAAGRIPRATGGMSRAGGAAMAGIGGAIAAGSVLASGGSVPEAIGAGVGTAVGSVAGGVAGATIGSALGPVGAAVGYYVGSAVGGWAGGAIGHAIGDWIDGDDLATEQIAGNGEGGTYTAEESVQINGLQSPIDFSPYGGVTIRFREYYGTPQWVTVNVKSIQGLENYERVPNVYGDGYQEDRWRLNYTVCGDPDYADWTAVSRYGPPGDIQLEILATGVCGQPNPESQPKKDTGRAPMFAGGTAPTADDVTAPRIPKQLPAPVSLQNPRASLPSSMGRPAPVPSGGTRPDDMGSPETSDPSLMPAPVPAPAPYESAKDTNTATIPLPGTDVAAAESEIDPYMDEIVETQIATGTDLGEVIATGQELGEANLEGTNQDPTLQAETDPNFEPVTTLPGLLPIPAAMPANRRVPAGMPRGLPKLRPSGATGQGIKGPVPPKTPFNTGTGGNCRCNMPILKTQQQILNQMGTQGQSQQVDLSDIKARLIRMEGHQTNPVSGFHALQAGQAATMTFLQTMNNFIKLAWEKTRMQKLLNALTFIGVMHNVLLLSRDVGETFFYLIARSLDAIGIEDEQGNTLDIQGMVGSTVENWIKGLIGEDLYNGVRTTWNKASAIIRSASMIIWTVRSISDSTLDLMEWISENTGKIGNALKRFGVVGERAYPWMSERAQARNRFRARFDKVTGAMENIEDRISTYSIATETVIEVQDEIGELGSNFTGFRETVIEAVPDPWEDNIPVADAVAQSKAVSESPDITASDTN